MEGQIWGKRREGEEDGRVSVEMITTVRFIEVEATAEDPYGMLYKTAYHENLDGVIALLERAPKREAFSAGWEVNPLRGVILARKTRISVAEVLLRHYGHELLLKARDPDTGNTLLHLAAQHQKQDLAIFFLMYLAKLKKKQKKKKEFDISTEQRAFLEAVNNDSQTALHIATANLLYDLVHWIVSRKQVKINMKDNDGKTALDLIKVKCDKCHLFNGAAKWKTPWEISILLRGSQARYSSDLKDYEDEEVIMRGQDVQIKSEARVVSIMVNDEAWNTLTNMILAIATLAFAFIFAAIFTVPQIIASGGGGGGGNTNFGMIAESLHHSLGKSIAFRVFVIALTLACLLMTLVVVVTISTIKAKRIDKRALILVISWICFIITGVALAVAYLIAIWLYMGYFFTSILIASCILIAFVLLLLAHCFDLLEPFWLSLSALLRLTLLYGFAVTCLRSLCSKCCYSSA